VGSRLTDLKRVERVDGDEDDSVVGREQKLAGVSRKRGFFRNEEMRAKGGRGKGNGELTQSRYTGGEGRNASR